MWNENECGRNKKIKVMKLTWEHETNRWTWKLLAKEGKIQQVWAVCVNDRLKKLNLNRDRTVHG